MSTSNLMLPSWYDQDIVSDIKPGLVLFLDPEDLKKAGGRCSGKPTFHVREPHFFLCLEVIKDEAFWTPLYSRSSNCRVLLDNDEKRGHYKWLRRTSYANLDEKWVLSTQAVCIAVARSNDKSRKGRRNSYLGVSFIF